MESRVNNRSLVQLEEETVQRIWHRALPLYWRYWSDYPSNRLAFLWYAINHLNEVTKFACSDGEADHFPITEKSIEEYRVYLEETAKSACERNPGKRLPGYEQMLQDSLVRIKTLIDHHNIKVITVQMPVMNAEIENLNILEIQRFNNLVAFSTSLGIRHIDLGDFDDNCFFDVVHLTAAGSEKFMHRLYKKLEWEIND